MWSEFSPLLTGVGIGLLFVVLERLAPARPRSPARLRRYATDLLHMTVGTQLIQLGTIALLALVLLLPLFAGGAVLAAGDLPWWLQLMLVLLMYAGRVGTITLATSLALGERRMPWRLPEEHPIVG